MANRKAVYAGSFDPPTLGHLWMIEQGAKLFDPLIVAVGVNPDKRTSFSLEDRLTMLKKITFGFPNVLITSFENQFLVNYAQKLEADFILRGIRSADDFNYEQGMRNVNSDLSPGIVTVFLIPPRELCEVSSSLVKGLIGPEGWESIVQKYVPQPVFEMMKEKYYGSLS